MTVGTILILVYGGVFYLFWTWRPWSAWVWAMVGLLLLTCYSCMYVAGEDDQWHEDNMGIRRS